MANVGCARTFGRANLGDLDRIRVGNELVLDLYQRDSVALLAQHKVTDIGSFLWQSYVKAEYEPPDAPKGGRGGGKGKAAAAPEGDAFSGGSTANVQFAFLGTRAPFGFMYTSGAHAAPVLTPAADRARLALLRVMVLGSGEVALLLERRAIGTAGERPGPYRDHITCRDAW
jgi:hypothetical protein